jgi:hypothetical protein
MKNRMSVLSRRLERFAVGFSIATFSVFLVGLYASANAKGQLVILCAGLFSACLFATFFLWLAHGFAWAMIPEKPADAMKSTEEMSPAEPVRPAEALKPAAVVLKPAETMRPAEEMKPEEVLKPAVVLKPADEEVIDPVDPPDAKYTITGKRIY